jgi:membrane protease YdiL (CAAX protease family)
LYHAPTLVQAIVLVAVAFVALLVAIAIARGVGCDQLATFAIAYGAASATMIVYAYRRLDLATIGLALPRARFIAAGAMVGIAMWYVSLRIVEWLPVSLRAPPIERELSDQGLTVTLLVVALAPALTEELVFRGILARGLATRLPMAVAIVLSAIVFSLVHGNAGQIAGTFTLGLVLGFIAIRSGSIVPTAIAHFTNNAIVILLTREDLPLVERTVDAHPDAMLVVALAIVAGGIALAARGVAA